MPVTVGIDYAVYDCLYAHSLQQPIDERYTIYPFDFRLESFYVYTCPN